MGGDERFRGETAALVGVLVALCAATAAVAAAPEPTGTTEDPIDGVEDPGFLEFANVSGQDSLFTRVRVDADGTGHWLVEYRFVLDDVATRTAFDRARENVSGPPGEFVRTMRNTYVADAESATGRSMEIQNATSAAERRLIADETTGVVTFRFEWRNFAARPSDTRLVVGDAIGGIALGANETLRIEWREGIRRLSVAPEPDVSRSGVVEWTGQLRFRSTAPTVELARDPPASGLPVTLLAAVAGAVALAAVGWFGRSRFGSEDGDDGVDEEVLEDDLLTDQERVIRLLEARGGRMKQQTLIETFDWSRTKASDVVNEMNEDGRIEVFRLGRENVLALPGEVEL